jgi:uncharacterized Zn-finger protein
LTGEAVATYLGASERQRQFPMTTELVPVTPDPASPEVVIVRSRRIACDGGGGALGHPRVWLEMGEAGVVECGYCDRRFVLAKAGEQPEDEQFAPGVYEGPGGH